MDVDIQAGGEQYGVVTSADMLIERFYPVFSESVRNELVKKGIGPALDLFPGASGQEGGHEDFLQARIAYRAKKEQYGCNWEMQNAKYAPWTLRQKPEKIR